MSYQSLHPFGFVLLAILMMANVPASNSLFFQIEQDSKLHIKGSSNVTDFVCKCEELFPRLQLEMEPKGTKTKFEKATLSIRSKKLDCGNKAMNKDMYETLKANDFPNIKIELLESELTKLDENWATLKAQMSLTIAGVNKKEAFTIQAKRNDELQYRFKSSKCIKMSDYGMTPPSPMFGLIKVKDQITLDLDLTISVLDKM